MHIRYLKNSIKKPKRSLEEKVVDRILHTYLLEKKSELHRKWQH